MSLGYTIQFIIFMNMHRKFKNIFVYYVYMLLVFIYYSISIYMELIVFLPISHHLATLNFFFQRFMFLRPFSSLKFRRLSLRRWKPDMQVIPSSLCWSNIQSGATPSSASRSPSWTEPPGVRAFFSTGPYCFFSRRVFEPLEHWREWWSLKNGYENFRAFPGLVTLNEMVLFSSVDWIDLLD